MRQVQTHGRSDTAQRAEHQQGLIIGKLAKHDINLS
jgi:hypothetical protein